MRAMTRKIVVAFVFIAIIISFKTQTVFSAFDCLQLTTSSSQTNKDFCRNELAQIEAQLAELLNRQKEQQKQTGTLKGDVDYLNSQINALKTKVKARSLAIAQLKVSINEKVSKIGSLNDRIAREHASLAQLLRNTNEFDNANLVGLVLSNQSLSEFYNDIESYSSIKQSIKNSVDEIKGIKIVTEEEKINLEKKQDAETDAKAELENAQRKVAQSEAEKKKLLAISKEKEASYLKLAAEKKAQADKIRSALFPLAGTTQKIEFGTALIYANEAKALLGIDPAFLLAIFTQESNLGSNVGQCYLSDLTSGYSINRATGKVWANGMKASRDLEPFIEITGRLGIDPLQTAISCPVASTGGYGGAMGPAQFIPSTWAIFENRLLKLLGYEASPWVPKDAFMASAMYLTDLGAIGSSASAQHRAACRYYGSGGASCAYSRSVMSLRSKIQDNIDLLSS